MFIFLGALLAALGLPLAMRWVPRNRLYGLRTRQTLNDDRVWYPANARSGRDFITIGLGVAAMGATLRLSGLRPETQVIAGNVALMTGLLIIAVRGIRHGRQLALAVPPRDATSQIAAEAMDQEPSSRAILINRSLAGAAALYFIGYLIVRRDYWGVTFATLVTLWVALRLPPQDLAWPRTARRIVEVAFALATLAAIWATATG